MSRRSRQREVALAHHADLDAPTADASLISTSVGPHEDAVCAWVLAPPPAIPAGSANGAPRSRHVLTAHQPHLVRSVEVSTTLPTFPIVQPRHDGGFFCVGNRSQWAPGGAELNAVVVDADGVVVTAHCIGDGISHALATASGDLWTGFFDEGIFGSAGWGHPGPPPLGYSGLHHRGPDLELVWEHDGLTSGWISDCYALNIDGDVAWAHVFGEGDDHTIIRVDDATVTTWPTTISDAEALLLGDTGVALIGGPRDHRGQVVLGQLESTFVQTATASITMPDGRPIPPSAQLHTRNDQLHVFIEQQWFRTDLDTIS